MKDLVKLHKESELITEEISRLKKINNRLVLLLVSLFVLLLAVIYFF